MTPAETIPAQEIFDGSHTSGAQEQGQSYMYQVHKALIYIAMTLLNTRKPVLGKPSMTAQNALNAALQPWIFDVTACATRKLPSVEIVNQRRYLMNHRLEQHPLWQNVVHLSSDVGDIRRCLTTAEIYTCMALENITTNTAELCSLGLGMETMLYVMCTIPTLLLFWRIIARVLCNPSTTFLLQMILT